MRYQIVRCDLDKCYRVNEYNEAIDYALKNSNIVGMEKTIEKLNKEKNIYKQDIANLIEPERETENEMYLLWEKWNKAKDGCFKIVLGLIGGTILCWILSAFLWSGLSLLGLIDVVLSIIMFLVFWVIKVIELICGNKYDRYINKIMSKIIARNKIFGQDMNRYYEEIDNLYLQSLDPAHREMVLMRREQDKYNQEMMRLEQERLSLERERVHIEKERQKEEKAAREEARQNAKESRRVQERLLQIEEDREIRRKSY